jgi:hypothetical protein
MRAAKPFLDVLLHCDDLEAAFRRVLYHPDLAVVFACMFMDCLIVPVGQVFGSRSAPSYFSLMSDIRAEVASTADLIAEDGTLEPLALSAILEPLPADWDPASDLTQVCPDALHPPLSPEELLCFANATFVDDNGVAAYRTQMRDALHQSVRAAYVLFGFPYEDRRQSCLSDDKWDPFVSHIMLCLGFLINFRDMTSLGPSTSALNFAILCSVSFAPKVMCRLLGLLLLLLASYARGGSGCPMGQLHVIQ